MRERRDLLRIGPLDGVAAVAAPPERQQRPLENVLVLGRVGGVDRQGRQEQPDEAGDVLPCLRPEIS